MQIKKGTFKLHKTTFSGKTVLIKQNRPAYYFIIGHYLFDLNRSLISKCDAYWNKKMLHIYI